MSEDGSWTRIELPHQPPYDAGAAYGLLAVHVVPGLERAEPELSRFDFLLESSAGPSLVRLTLKPDNVSAEVDRADAAETEMALRRMLDLDASPAAVGEAFATHPLLGDLVRQRPGLRVTGYPNGTQAAIQTVVGQQVSLAAARTFTGRLVAAYGRPGPSGLTRFPTAEALAGLSEAELRAAVGLTGARARTVIAVAQACSDGLVLNHEVDPVETRARLLALPGVGPWTADYLAVRVLGDRDAFPAGDLVLRKALGVRTPAEAVAAVESCRPYRAYALFHLWHSTGFAG